MRRVSGDGAVLVPVKVVPGASRSRIVGPLGDRLKVAVSAPPSGGAANEEVVRLVAERLGLPVSAVRVVAGASSPRKTLAIAGGGAEAVRKRLWETPS